MSIAAICGFRACGKEATHTPCCSSHGHLLCCECYRFTHFVEVGPCCGQPSPEEEATRAELARLETVLIDLEREDPSVGAAARDYEAMSWELRGRSSLNSIREILSPDPSVASPQEESPGQS